MLSSRAPRVFAGVLAVGMVLSVSPVRAQFFSQATRPGRILEGHWQSCQEPPDYSYSERVYDHVVNGVGQFEVHLGPRYEFAMFAGVEDEHREHDHPDNLLKPHRVVPRDMRAGRRWEIPTLNLAFSVTLGGGGRTDCESWFVLLEPLEQTSD